MKSYMQQRHLSDRFLLILFMAAGFQPFSHLIAKCEISEGHICLWLLLVRGAEQITLHVAPVIIKHLSLKNSRQKAVQCAFIQVHGRNTRVRV